MGPNFDQFIQRYAILSCGMQQGAAPWSSNMALSMGPPIFLQKIPALYSTVLDHEFATVFENILGH
jgi:hypothetical protein